MVYRITSYNVCYTKLLRSGIIEKIEADSKVTQLRITLLVEAKSFIIPLLKVEELIELE